MMILPMPADWMAEHTSDAAFRRAIFEAFRIPAHLLRDPHLFIIVDMTMPEGRMSLVSESGDTVRVSNIRTGDA
jgi:hypothetical protein